MSSRCINKRSCTFIYFFTISSDRPTKCQRCNKNCTVHWFSGCSWIDPNGLLPRSALERGDTKAPDKKDNYYLQLQQVFYCFFAGTVNKELAPRACSILGKPSVGLTLDLRWYPAFWNGPTWSSKCFTNKNLKVCFHSEFIMIYRTPITVFKTTSLWVIWSGRNFYSVFSDNLTYLHFEIISLPGTN